MCFANNVFIYLFYFFAWFSKQTAIIALYSINWLVVITEAEFFLWGKNWVFKQDRYSIVRKGLRLDIEIITDCCEIWWGEFSQKHNYKIWLNDGVYLQGKTTCFGI